MSCCCNKKPRVRLVRKMLFTAQPTWNDLDRCSGGMQRLLQWRFYKNNTQVWASAFGQPTAALGIGSGSTYLHLNATSAQIGDFLVSQGISLSLTDTICVDVKVKNCQGEYAVSNRICFAAEVSQVDCTCSFVTAFASGQTGDTAAAPSGYIVNGGQLVFSNGLMNPAENDFGLMPLEAQDSLAWVTLDEACDAGFAVEEVTGQVGTVNLPPAFAALPVTDYLVFRNGAAQRTFSVAGGLFTPQGAESEAADRWHFVRLQSGSDGCKLRRLTINANVSGSTFNLPSGYSASNQAKWLLFVNELLQYPSANYTVSGGQITLLEPASNDAIWIVAIV